MFQCEMLMWRDCHFSRLSGYSGLIPYLKLHVNGVVMIVITISPLWVFYLASSSDLEPLKQILNLLLLLDSSANSDCTM